MKFILKAIFGTILVMLTVAVVFGLLAQSASVTIDREMQKRTATDISCTTKTSATKAVRTCVTKNDLGEVIDKTVSTVTIKKK